MAANFTKATTSRLLPSNFLIRFRPRFKQGANRPRTPTITRKSYAALSGVALAVWALPPNGKRNTKRTAMFITTPIIVAPEKIKPSNAPSRPFGRSCLISNYQTFSNPTKCRRIGRPRFPECPTRTRRKPSNPRPVSFKGIKPRYKPSLKNSNAFLTPILTKIFSGKHTAWRRQTFSPARSRWRRKWPKSQGGYPLGLNPCAIG